MSKTTKPINKSYPPVRLYIDDLKSINELLKKIGGQVKIENNGCIVENLDSLKNLEKEKTNYFTFTLLKDSYKTGAYAKIIFHSSYNELYFAENIPANRNVLSDIKKILRKRRLFWSYFGYGRWQGSVISILILLGYILQFAGIDFSKWHSIGYVYLIVITGWLALYSFSPKDCATIMLKNKIDEYPFWTRNKEKIAMGVSAGFLGAAIVFSIMFELMK